MATTTNVERLESLVAKLVTMLPNTVSSSSSPSSTTTYNEQIKEAVEKLRRTMRRIRALLVDAEGREIRDDGVKLWLDELRDLAYDAEDVIEDFEYELRRKAYQEEAKEEKDDEEEESQKNQQIMDKIKEINNRFDEIYNCRSALCLSEIHGKEDKKQMEVERLPTSSLLCNSTHVYGRNFDKEEVIDMLLSLHVHEHGTDHHQNVTVVSIMGMGGIGKTTLAQLVYNDDRIQDHYQLRMWVCVSDYFDVLKLTREILETITRKASNLQGFNQLQEELQHNLYGKRFLLVLDDLWNENWQHWESLWKPLSSGAEGSKVLVTTRNKLVSETSCSIKTHHLMGLSSHKAWSLFAECAFGSKNPDDYPNLMSIGKHIVKKCGGVPLALKTLGALLLNKIDEDEWKIILESDIWELPEQEGNYILRALRLSYHHLPSPVKPCFAVCAVFPKDYLFERKELVRFWMAQGYITPGRRKSMEAVGREYFDVLVQRSFFQIESSFHGLHHKMHDLIHDLALSIWGNECCTVEDGKLPGDIGRKVRHMSFECAADITTLLCGSPDAFRHLRTAYSLVPSYYYAISFKVVDDMFRNMKYLWVLKLHNLRLRKLPDSIGNLKHLRYLHVATWNVMDMLPQSVCELLNLQILEVSRDYNLIMMPRHIGRLTNLRTLRRFVVGKGIHAAGIGELKHLNHLQGELMIDVRSLDNWCVNSEPNIMSQKKGLERLELLLKDHSDGKFDAKQQHAQEELLESLQPHTNIKELSISKYVGNRLPEWMGHPSYSSLHTISLSSFRNHVDISAFGQLPSLRYLSVSSECAVNVSDGVVVEGAFLFLSLEELSFSCQQILEEFFCIGTDEGSAFPRLHKLQIRDCGELRRVKLRHLSALRVLNIINCREVTTLDYCCDSTSHLSYHMHIPHVHTMHLLRCPKLDFRPTVIPQRQLPPSLWCFNVDHW